MNPEEYIEIVKKTRVRIEKNQPRAICFEGIEFQYILYNLFTI